MAKAPANSGSPLSWWWRGDNDLFRDLKAIRRAPRRNTRTVVAQYVRSAVARSASGWENRSGMDAGVNSPFAARIDARRQRCGSAASKSRPANSASSCVVSTQVRIARNRVDEFRRELRRVARPQREQRFPVESGQQPFTVGAHVGQEQVTEGEMAQRRVSTAQAGLRCRERLLVDCALMRLPESELRRARCRAQQSGLR